MRGPVAASWTSGGFYECNSVRLPGGIAIRRAHARNIGLVREHGAGLSDLVDILDDKQAIDAFCNWAANLGATTPCPSVSRAAIGTILDALSQVSIPEADRLGYCWGTDIGAATRWYGARLAELRTKLAAVA